MLLELMLRRATVDRSRTAQAALTATGRNLHITPGAVAAIHQGEGDEVEMVFFQADPEVYKSGWISDTDLQREYEKHGLEPDPIALAAVNEANPTLADRYPHGAHWKNEDGTWWYIAFHLANSERYVYVHRSTIPWYIGWVFAGRRKVPRLASAPDAPSIVTGQPIPQLFSR